MDTLVICKWTCAVLDSWLWLAMTFMPCLGHLEGGPLGYTWESQGLAEQGVCYQPYVILEQCVILRHWGKLSPNCRSLFRWGLAKPRTPWSPLQLSSPSGVPAATLWIPLQGCKRNKNQLNYPIYPARRVQESSICTVMSVDDNLLLYRIIWHCMTLFPKEVGKQSSELQI